MKKETNLKEFEVLKRFRDTLYNSLTDDEKERIDKKEIEFGAEKVAEMFSNMHPMSIACILKSFFEANPKVITDVVNFSDFIDKSFDVFGADKTAKMISKAINKIEDELEEKIKDDVLIEKKLKEMNGETEEYSPVVKSEKDDDLKDMVEFLKSRGWDVELETIKGDKND